jgi:hypothetical protein
MAYPTAYRIVAIVTIIAGIPSISFSSAAQNRNSKENESVEVSQSVSEVSTGSPLHAPPGVSATPDTSAGNQPVAHFEPAPEQLQPVAPSPQAKKRPEKPDPRFADRLVVEAVLGLAGNGLILGSVYAFPGGIYEFILESSEGGREVGALFALTSIGVVTLSMVVAAFTVPAGVYLGGKMVDGDGGYGWAFLGHLGGIAAGFLSCLVLTSAFDISASNGGWALTMSVAAVLQVSGAITAYELSSAANRRRKNGDAVARNDFVIMPTVALVPQGGAVGIGGTF